MCSRNGDSVVTFGEKIMNRPSAAFSCPVYPSIVAASRSIEPQQPIQQTSEPTLGEFIAAVAATMRRGGHPRTAETYVATFRSFSRFLVDSRGVADLPLGNVDSPTIESYAAWLAGCRLCPNTVSFYLRILRAALSRAVDTGMIASRPQFRHVYTGIDRTVKRAITPESIGALSRLKLPAGSASALARDMFLLSFYLRGMSFVGLCHLRHTDLRGGYVTYRRRKTGRTLTIAWTAEMQRIADRHPAPASSPYLLPLINPDAPNPRWSYINTASRINRELRRLGAAIGLQQPLTLYVARHSWASIAQSKGIPLSVISQGMGHDSEQTTRIYLASLDTAVVDRANSIIISSI